MSSINPGISSEKELKEYIDLLDLKPKSNKKYQALLYDWEVEAVKRIKDTISPDDKEAKAVFARLLHYANEALFVRTE